MKSILLVDDDSNTLLAVGMRLKGMGYTVFTAKDAVNAVSAVRKNQPDIAVIDISLPGGSGFVVAERLRNLIASAATPVVFITASQDPSLREQASRLGCVGFLQKPFDATQLADTIEMACTMPDTYVASAGAQ